MPGILLLTPPFTQLNTPYPATAYLQGFLRTQNIPCAQADLGLDLILVLFSRAGLEKVFEHAEASRLQNENLQRIVHLKEDYLNTVESVVSFLQGQLPTLADRIAGRRFLPEAGRFEQTDDLLWAFGEMGLQDRAKYIATLYLEDLGDFIRDAVDPHFGFSRYAEQLGRSARSFDELDQALQQPEGLIDQFYLHLLDELMKQHQPSLVCFSVPFPGNLYAALRGGAHIRSKYPGTQVAMGGGFPNTELRSLSDPRVFRYVDYVCMDDGETPLLQLYRHISEPEQQHALVRTFRLQNGSVHFDAGAGCRDIPFEETGTPDYAGLDLKRYLSVMEMANPMHRLWSDGQWLKLTMARGCYWGKCTFCDTKLPYIQDYVPASAALIADRMEALMKQTGCNGFHFVDEAAPPALMKALALEILKRKLVVSWWTNIRFEKSFSRDLCRLLAASGCIAVSGGLEVASDRLLALIKKGVTVEQVARVTQHFTEAGIMVHAYLMYGYPTQTEQETVDSLEMVRQLFAEGVLQSGFWHRFALTAHSPVGHDPNSYRIRITNGETAPFANNDLEYEEQKQVPHERYSFGLKKSLYNFMHRTQFDAPLQTWFDFRIPATTVAKDAIRRMISEEGLNPPPPQSRVVFPGPIPEHEILLQQKKGRSRELLQLTFFTTAKTIRVSLTRPQGEWLLGWLPALAPVATPVTFGALKQDYEEKGLEDFDLFWFNKPMQQCGEWGLLVC